MYAYDPSSDGIDFNVYSGVYYPRVLQGDALYCMSRPLDSPFYTFEAWVYLYDVNDKSGVLFSNKADGSGDYFAVETDKNGALCVKSKCFNAVFKPLAVCEWVHIATVIKNDTLTLFINGKMQGEVQGDIAIEKSTVLNPFCVGGDLEYQNYPPFRGRVREICLYSYPKTKRGIIHGMEHGADLNDAGLVGAYSFENYNYGKNIVDNSKNANTLIFSKTWLSESEAEEFEDTERCYSFAVVGDTQYMSEFYPTALSDMYGWIADNKEKKNIELVIGLGDMTNRDTYPEWENVKRGISRLGDIPYTVIRGNHDIKDYSEYANNAYHLSQSGRTGPIGKSTGGAGFDGIFGADGAYTSELGGVYESGSVANSWRILEVYGTKWLILCLDYMPEPPVLEWASSVLSSNTDCRVIVTTHAYLDRNGKRLDYCEYLWEDFVSKHSNISLVLSGHINSARVVTSRQQNVTQMLVDMQSCDNRFRGAGFVTLIHFNRDGTKCEVECVSTSSLSRGLYYRGINCFDLDLAA